VENDAWMAWQFDRPDLGEGMIQAFRRAESPYYTTQLRLRGLDPEAQYMLTDLDVNEPWTVSGRELMEPGLLLTIAHRPGAVVITYQKGHEP
jgi:alpha-galactosidase